MSIRLTACGVNTTEVFSRFGSRNTAFLEPWKEIFSEARLAILQRAVMEGVPFPGLVEESWDHMHVVEQLFRNSHDTTPGDFEFHYLSLTEALQNELYPDLADPTINLLEFFVKGRPVFGRKFAAPESFYGYLRPDEVVRLNDDLQPFALPEPDSPDWDDLPLEMLNAGYTEFTGALTDLFPELIKKKQGLAISIG